MVERAELYRTVINNFVKIKPHILGSILGQYNQKHLYPKLLPNKTTGCNLEDTFYLILLKLQVVHKYNF